MNFLGLLGYKYYDGWLPYMEIIHNQGVEVDLLLANVIIPGTNRIELAKALVTNAPKTKTIFTSGYMPTALSFLRKNTGKSR